MGIFQSLHNLFGESISTEESSKAIVLDTYSPVEKLISKKEMKSLDSLYVSGPARAGKGEDIIRFVKQISLKYNNLKKLDLSGIIGLDEISEEALAGCKSLVHIILPKGIRTIKNSAFEGCHSLETIILPEGLERIYESAFSHCEKLNKVNLPKTLYRLGKEVFYGDYSLTSITIPSRVESIGTKALSCKNLKQIIVESHNPSYIAIDNVLYNRNGSVLIQYACGLESTRFVIPETVAKIVDEAFAECQHISQIEFTKNVSIIGKGAFSKCENLKNVILSSKIETIGDEAFFGCSVLTNVSFKEGITGIGARAFYNCKSLTCIKLPHSIIKIGEEAFANCSALEDCKIPSSTEYLGKNIFSNTRVNK